MRQSSLRVGGSVRVRADMSEDRVTEHLEWRAVGWHSRMNVLAGRVVEITQLTEDGGRAAGWAWHADWLEPVSTCPRRRARES